MATYRLYRLSHGHFTGATEIDAATDAEALGIAMTREFEEGVEIWCGSRKVGVLGETASAETTPAQA